MPERRRYVRWQINYPAKIKLSGAEAFSLCQIHDLSFKGAKISFSFKLPPDTFFQLKILLSDDFILDVESWVVWHKTVDGYYVYGLYFNKIPDKDKEKIYQFIRKNFLKELSKQWWPDKEKGGETMEDRRIFARFPARFPAHLLDPRSGKEAEAQTQDISAKGIGLVSDEELKPQTSLEIWIKVHEKTEPIYTRGEVVWVKEVAPQQYRFGVNLERADLMSLARLLRA